MNYSFSSTAAKFTALLFASFIPVAVIHAQSYYPTPYAVTTVAGTPGNFGSVDGTGMAAQFNTPTSVAVDGAGNAYVADTANQTIRKITPAGVVTTLAGSPGGQGTADGTGSAAQFNGPYGIAADSAGTLYVADINNHAIRKITSGGVVTTLAGLAGTSGSSDGTGSAARFNQPAGVAVDSAGNVYVADSQNHTIRLITPAGAVTTIAGLAASLGVADGSGSTARFNHPTSVAVDGSGNVYVADTFNHTIRKIAAGAVTTFAGLAATHGLADGMGGAARFYDPAGVAVDVAGNVYVGDSANNMLRKITPGGAVTTLAGGPFGTTDGTGPNARFRSPCGVSVDATGQLFVADADNHSIRKATAAVPGDYNGDHHVDIVWENTSTGDRGFWLMNGTSFASWVDLGIVSSDWHIAVTGDFNGDGQTDFLWENTVTGDRGFWLMNGTAFASWVGMGNMPTAERIVGVADFNNDGQADIFWENTATGDRNIWLMNGTTPVSSVHLGNVPVEWRMAGAADFNGDGHPDLMWENTITGDRYVWFLNGTSTTGATFLGNVSTDWHITSVVDFNGDGKPDILWENTVTGDRYIWFLDGTTVTSATDLGIVTTDWHITN